MTFRQTPGVLPRLLPTFHPGARDKQFDFRVERAADSASFKSLKMENDCGEDVDEALEAWAEGLAAAMRPFQMESFRLATRRRPLVPLGRPWTLAQTTKRWREVEAALLSDLARKPSESSFDPLRVIVTLHRPFQFPPSRRAEPRLAWQTQTRLGDGPRETHAGDAGRLQSDGAPARAVHAFARRAQGWLAGVHSLSIALTYGPCSAHERAKDLRAIVRRAA